MATSGKIPPAMMAAVRQIQREIAGAAGRTDDFAVGLVTGLQRAESIMLEAVVEEATAA